MVLVESAVLFLFGFKLVSLNVELQSYAELSSNVETELLKEEIEFLLLCLNSYSICKGVLYFK